MGGSQIFKCSWMGKGEFNSHRHKLATAALLNANGLNLIANPGTIFCPIGTIDMVIGVGSTTGTWAQYLRYKPLAVGVTVS